jgi:outer membrane receptor protein involved in Fe transport
MNGSMNANNWTNDGQKISYYNSDGSNNNNSESYAFRGSLSFDLGEKKLLTFGGRYSHRTSDDNSNTDYHKWTSLNLLKSDYLSKTDGSRSRDEISIFTNYKHPFNSTGHEIYIEASYDYDKADKDNSNLLYNQEPVVSGKINNENTKDSEFRGKVDYTFPINESDKLEAGYKGQYEISDENDYLSTYDVLTSSFLDNPLFNNDGKYYTGEHSLYAVYTSNIDKFGYKLGLRNEYTGRDIKVESKNLEYKINRWEYFPTLHLSYDFGSGNQIMSSYTKRINRPNGWELEPVVTWIDAYNVRKGNPALLPEYIDSYELGYQMLVDKSLFSVDAYYRITKNKIERVLSVYEDDVTLQTSSNVGKDYSLGTELFFNFDPINGWNVNLMGNIYNYKIDAVMNGADVAKNSFNWSMRFNNSVKLGQSTSFQLNTQYNSPSVSSQGSRESFVSSNLGIKQELFNRFMTATLQIRDLFRTAKFEFVSESTDFYSYRNFKRESPVVMLSLRFNFNNFKMEKSVDDNNGTNGNNEEF